VSGRGRRKVASDAGADGDDGAGDGAPILERGADADSRGEAPPAPACGGDLIQLLSPEGAWLGGSGGSPFPPSLLIELYRGMQRVRLLDGRMLNLQRQGRIGFFGQSTGQEAAIVGSAAALRPEDWVAPALREAGVALWRGLPIERLIAQCMGKGSEVSRGRQMPCHHSFRAANFVSMSSVIATQLLHAVGIARAAQLKKDQIVAMGYLGDGATSEHDFHGALNLAGVWKAPVVFFCQNNQWAISVPFARQTAARSIAAKASAYGMPGVRVDGNDVLAVLGEATKAVERARAGGGPTLIEALTYRRLGHSSSDDPTRYREASEVAKWEALDPIDRLRRHLRALGLLDAAKEESIEEELQAQISEGIRLGEAGKEPPLESLFTDVFGEMTPQLREQLAATKAEFAHRELPKGHGR
jgi:pyruvate dehydrogenase E1 component alpha subunit/2-oxoisovalerate dehydrogenase E1 component alpha subunit